MRNTTFISVLIFFLATTIGAVDVVIQGSSLSEAKELRKIIKESTMADSMLTLLRNKGYLDAQVRLNDNKLVITPGPLYRIDSIYCTTGDSNFVIVPDKIFNQNSLQEITDRIMDDYFDLGYYWASAKISQVGKRNEKVVLQLRIIKGPLVEIKDKLFTGLVRSRHDLVAKYIPVEPGDTLTDETVRRAQTAAARIPFVNFYPPVSIRPHEGYTKADLEFRFLEKRQLGFEIGGGYLPDSRKSLVWHLNLNFNNLFGWGRDASILSERREQDRNILHIRYTQPLFWAGVGSLQLQAATRDYRQQFYEFSLEGLYSSRISSDIDAGLSLGWKNVKLTGNTPAYSRFSTQFSIERKALDDRVNPANGLSLSWSIAYAYRRYADDSLAFSLQQVSFNETRTAIAVKWYKKLFSKLVAHLGFNYVGLETDESLPPISELTFIGGPGTVRGYRNEQFVTLKTAYGAIEPRWRFSNGFLFIFYDAAYLNNRVTDSANPERGTSTQEMYRYGYGVGLALHDMLRGVKISLGWHPELPLNQPRLSVEFSTDI
ncbi:MAG: BamA/TamA family outer membrane protein [Candidatus Zixiibacteriota bacterium]